MNSREVILEKIRSGLGRTSGQPVPPPPPVRIAIPDVPVEQRIQTMFEKIEALAGKTYLAASKEGARDYVAKLVEGRDGVCSNDPFLSECGITALPNIASGLTDREELRAHCATRAVGVTSATYTLSDTGTLVMMFGEAEARLVSLLPPVHCAVVPRQRILTGLDEFLSLHPQPVEDRSSTVFITGPSRTADIEQILVRGVHGPGEIHVVVV